LQSYILRSKNYHFIAAFNEPTATKDVAFTQNVLLRGTQSQLFWSVNSFQ